MAEDNTGNLNLDLNLGPTDNARDDGELGSGHHPNVSMYLEDWLDGHVHTVSEVVRQENQRWPSLWRQVPIPPETRNLAMELIGEGSVTPEERPTEVVKMCENCNFAEDYTLCKKEEGKNSGDDGNFFDCNICLDLAKEPVVTCCGHLFCWPCIYQWLHNHSDAKECPVCKGEVTIKNVTPIYGRGNNKPDQDTDAGLKIPLRPQARRVESWRQTIQRTAFTIPMEEMIRRLGSTFDFSRELSQLQSDNPLEASPERGISLFNRILTSRAMRRERPPAVQSDDLIDVTEPNYEARNIHWLRRSTSRRNDLSNLTSAINSADSLAAERLVESYFHSNPVERNHEPLPPFDDRDSLSSIAAVIHSESQTVDNAFEIDSTVSHSTLSSRRRNDASRIWDVDSGDSRAPQRRRLN